MVKEMLTLIDRVIIWWIGINGLFIEEMTINAKVILNILVSGIALCVLYILDHSKCEKIQRIFCISILLLTILIPDLNLFMGLVLYSLMYKSLNNKSYIFGILSLTVIINIFFAKNPEVFNIFYIIISYLVAIIMGVKTRIIKEKNVALQNVRDDSTEKNNILSAKNKYLLENQENQIHIATLSERNRIAREIHDNVGHLLSRSILQVGACIAVNKGTNIEKQLIPIKDTLDEAMTSIRNSVHDLHKDGFDLKVATKTILDEMNNFKIVFEYDMSENIDKNVKHVFITILKEAITNIEKHSDGDSVIVIMRELDKHYQLLIEDNGKKIAKNSDKYVKGINAGIGLANMEERVKSLNGIINFSFENGFRIFISAPKED